MKLVIAFAIYVAFSAYVLHLAATVDERQQICSLAEEMEAMAQ